MSNDALEENQAYDEDFHQEDVGAPSLGAHVGAPSSKQGLPVNFESIEPPPVSKKKGTASTSLSPGRERESHYPTRPHSSLGHSGSSKSKRTSPGRGVKRGNLRPASAAGRSTVVRPSSAAGPRRPHAASRHADALAFAKPSTAATKPSRGRRVTSEVAAARGNQHLAHSLLDEQLALMQQDLGGGGAGVDAKSRMKNLKDALEFLKETDH